MASGYKLSSMQGYPDFSAAISGIGSGLAAGLEGIFKVRGGYSEAAEARKQRFDEVQLSRIGGLADQYSVVDRRKIDNGIDRAELYMMEKVYHEAVSQADIVARAKELKDAAELKIKQRVADGALASEKLALRNAALSGDVIAQAAHVYNLKNDPRFKDSSPETQSVVNRLESAMSSTPLVKGATRSLYDAVNVAMNKFRSKVDRGAALIEAVRMTNNGHAMGALNVGFDDLFGKDVVNAAWARQHAVSAYVSYLRGSNPQAADRLNVNELLISPSMASVLSTFNTELSARMKQLERERQGLVSYLESDKKEGAAGISPEDRASITSRISEYDAEIQECAAAAGADTKLAEQYLDELTTYFSMAALAVRKIKAIELASDGMPPQQVEYLKRRTVLAFEKSAEKLIRMEGTNSIQEIVNKYGFSPEKSTFISL